MENKDLLQRFGKGLRTQPSLEKNTVIYTRVSSKEQADNNKSLEWQKKYCEDYAAKNGLTVLGFFGGTYESAKTDERNEFNRMIRFVKTRKEKVSSILVYSLDRFSRSGENAIYISSQLKKSGIQIVSVSQPIDSSTHTGTLQQNIQFIFSKYDNDLRTQKTIDGMREKLRRGEWTGGCPRGYSYVRVKGEKYQRIVINKTGVLLRQAFLWRANQNMSHTVIAEKLARKGLKINRKRLTEIFQNPFYCGYMTNRVLQGEVIKGKHEPIISEEIFLQVNNLMSKNKKNEKTSRENENLPLKHFIKCVYCGTPYTGYLVKSKNLYYYKCNAVGCKCNRSAKQLEKGFTEVLEGFRVNDAYRDALKEQMLYTYQNLTDTHADEKRVISTRMNEAKERLMQVEERYACGEIDRAVYLRVTEKLNGEIQNYKHEMEALTKELSNPEEVISFTIDLCEKLASGWESGGLYQKIALQNLMFPDGLMYDRKNDEYRTENAAMIFQKISSFPDDYDKNKSGKLDWNASYSARVASTGIEPVSKV